MPSLFSRARHLSSDLRHPDRWPGMAAAGIAAHVGEPADTATLRGRKRHAKTDKTDARHLRSLLAEGRLPECWIPPAQILEYRALLELYTACAMERGRPFGMGHERAARGTAPVG